MRRPALLLLAGLVGGLLGGLACAPSPPIVAAPAATPPAAPPPAADPTPAAEQATIARFAADPRIGVYTSTPWSFSTASYWIEGPTGLVLIDTQFLPSAATDLADAAERMTGKKVELAIVLHANPDKFNGTATLQARGVRVVTSDAVRALIPGIHAKRHRAFHERYDPDYPRDAAAPEGFGANDTVLTAGGLTLAAHVLGPGCSESHVAVTWEGHLFAGDLLAAGTHSWLEIGRTDQWLSRLAELRAHAPRFVHPGRGPSGGPVLLDDEEAYLRKVIALVAAERPVMPPPEGALARVRARVEEAYPGYGFPVFLRLGLPAEWARQAAVERANEPDDGR